MTTENQAKVRIDKWLWAARFFKTRALAKQAVEGGKVHYNGSRVKTSKLMETGAELTIRQGWSQKTVVVLALSEHRRGAKDAELLYQETAESEAKRLLEAEQRKLQRAALPAGMQRPTKKQRRQIIQFKSTDSNE